MSSKKRIEEAPDPSIGRDINTIGGGKINNPAPSPSIDYEERGE